MSIEVEEPGMLTTIQDLGRFGYQDIGIPPSGAMDNYALRVGNILVDNREGEAGLEITFKGPTLLFQKDCIVAITGGDLNPQMNGEVLPLWESFLIKAGDRISFGTPRAGMRAYLAVSGGIEVENIMGSRSTYLRNQLGGFEGRALKKGDILKLGSVSGSPKPKRRTPQDYIPEYKFNDIRVVLGPQQNFFTAEGIETFLSSKYKVTSESDRMGIRLDGPVIDHSDGADIISDAVPLGGVQVPGNGKPIILTADRQTTGGYTKIATVISVDVDCLAQAKPGDEISFKEVSVQKAQKVLRKKEEDIHNLKSKLEEVKEGVRKMVLTTEGRSYTVKIERLNENESHVWVDGEKYEVRKKVSEVDQETPSETAIEGSEQIIQAPLPGKIQRIPVSQGSRVENGQLLIILEAMKMENSINSPIDGIIKEILVNKGDKVEDGQDLLILERL